MNEETNFNIREYLPSAAMAFFTAGLVFASGYLSVREFNLLDTIKSINPIQQASIPERTQGFQVQTASQVDEGPAIQDTGNKSLSPEAGSTVSAENTDESAAAEKKEIAPLRPEETNGNGTASSTEVAQVGTSVGEVTVIQPSEGHEDKNRDGSKKRN